MNKKNYINLANKAANIQINELKKIKKVFNKSFVKAIELIINCKGKVIFSGVGKNSFICKKAAATFSSVGIPSFYVDPTGVSHGDAGQIQTKDILIIISNSGNTKELKNLLEKHKNHSIFMDLPIGRTKPPNNSYSIDELGELFKNYKNIKYFAISNAKQLPAEPIGVVLSIIRCL